MLVRAGHTEAGCDLGTLAGLTPASVICEIMNDDGSMARLDDLIPFARRHGLKIGTIADLIAYRRRHDKLIERVVSTNMPTAFGEFTVIGYHSLVDDKHHVAMVKGDVAGKEDVLVRVHSECLTGDVFHSLKCDCGPQLDAALRAMADEARGGGGAEQEANGELRRILDDPGAPPRACTRYSPVSESRISWPRRY